jgi:hypothetical protein
MQANAQSMLNIAQNALDCSPMNCRRGSQILTNLVDREGKIKPGVR